MNRKDLKVGEYYAEDIPEIHGKFIKTNLIFLHSGSGADHMINLNNCYKIGHHSSLDSVFRYATKEEIAELKAAIGLPKNDIVENYQLY